MKKFTVFGAALLLGTAVNVQAQDVTYPASASTEIFDFTPWDDDQLLVLFAKAADEGRKYPTKEEFEAAGFNLDLEFSRSHVRPAAIMEDATKNIVPDVYPTRRLWMNIPTGQGDLIGGGITGGYRLRLNKALNLDFNLGLGYLNADFEKYEVIDGVRVRRGCETKDWWGPINAGVTLVWKLF